MNSHGIYIKAMAGVSLSLWKHISREAPVVHNLALFLLSPPVKHTFLLCDLDSLLSIFSLFPLVLKQAVYCVCSAEQPTLKALYICVFAPASLSDRVNPSEALVTSSLPCPFFLSSSLHWFVFPSQAADMLSYLPVRDRLPPCRPITREVTPVDLTGSDSNQEPMTMSV